jgi:hypothetical protein
MPARFLDTEVSRPASDFLVFPVFGVVSCRDRAAFTDLDARSVEPPSHYVQYEIVMRS